MSTVTDITCSVVFSTERGIIPLLPGCALITLSSIKTFPSKPHSEALKLRPEARRTLLYHAVVAAKIRMTDRTIATELRNICL